MDKRALEVYAMIGSKQPIIDWLNTEGVKTRKEAQIKLNSIGAGIAMATFTSGASSSRTFDGATSFMDRIANTFPVEEEL